MRRWITITIAIVVWVAVIAYIVVSVGLRREQRRSLNARNLTIVVNDSSAIDIVRVQDVAQWIDTANLNPIGRQMDSIGTDKLEAMIASHPFVRSVKAFGDIRGDVYVVMTQREPMFRIVDTLNGDFYYTTDGYIERVQPHSAHYVPVITGSVPLPFEAGYTGNLSSAEGNYEHYLQIFDALRNFVGYITQTPEWKDAFEQIVFERTKNGGYRVRLVPRVGQHTILLGELDDYESKLARLVIYYREVAPNEGWNKFREIDVQYKGEVIGRI